MTRLEDRAFLLLVAAVSVAFAALLWPFFGAILWGTVLAIMFAPLWRRLAGPQRKKRTLAAFVSLAAVIVIVILPVIVVGGALADEASGVFKRIQSGELNFGRYFRQVFDALPAWASGLLQRFDLLDAAAVQERLSGGLAKASQFLAAQALAIGQNTLEFFVSLGVMLYLLFFLLRDGDLLFKRIRAAVPLRREQQDELFSKFAIVVRATVKGTLVVAIVQGALGGLIFWILGVPAPLLWAVLMAVLSLLPAVGTALVWVPVAIYFLATGAVWQGVVLIAYGVLVIGMVDNLLRPILVGRDTKIPDYVVLISTLGGMALFGPNGFVIGPLIAAMFIAAWDIFAASRGRSST